MLYEYFQFIVGMIERGVVYGEEVYYNSTVDPSKGNKEFWTGRSLGIPNIEIFDMVDLRQ